MQDSILLVVKENTLRRLYHGLLLNQGVEVIPMSRIEDALVFQALNPVPLVVIYPDDMDVEVVRSYLNLQQDYPKLSHDAIVLLTSQGDDCVPKNHAKVSIVDVSKLNPMEVVHQILTIYDACLASSPTPR